MLKSVDTFLAGLRDTAEAAAGNIPGASPIHHCISLTALAECPGGHSQEDATCMGAIRVATPILIDGDG